MKKSLLLLFFVLPVIAFSQIDYYSVANLVSDSLDNHPTMEQMNSALSSYETISAFNTAMANYTNTSGMNALINQLMTKADSSRFTKYRDSTIRYVTPSQQMTALLNYSTTAQMTSAISSAISGISYSIYALKSDTTNQFRLGSKNTVADSTIFNDNIITKDLIPNTTNSFDLGKSNNAYKTLYLINSPVINGVTNYGISNIQSNQTLPGSIVLLATLLTKLNFITEVVNGITRNTVVYVP